MARERDSGEAPDWWILPFFWLPLGLLIWVVVICLCVSALRWAELIPL